MHKEKLAEQKNKKQKSSDESSEEDHNEDDEGDECKKFGNPIMDSDKLESVDGKLFDEIVKKLYGIAVLSKHIVKSRDHLLDAFTLKVPLELLKFETELEDLPENLIFDFTANFLRMMFRKL